MARRVFGEQVQIHGSNPSATVKAYLAPTGGSPVEVTDSDGNILSGGIITLVNDVVPVFKGPNDGTATLWLDTVADTADGRIATHATDANPTPTVGDSNIPAAIARDSEVTAAVAAEAAARDAAITAATGTSSPVGLGHFADSANYTDLSVSLVQNVPYTLVPADLNASDSSLIPASDNAFEMSADGRIPLPSGGIYILGSYGDASFATAPTTDMELDIGPFFRVPSGSIVTILALDASAAATIPAPTRIRSDGGATKNTPGNGAATDLDSSIDMMIVAVTGPDVTVEFTAYLGNIGPDPDPETTLYNAELSVRRII